MGALVQGYTPSLMAVCIQSLVHGGTESQSPCLNLEQLWRASHSSSRTFQRPPLYHSSTSPSAQSRFSHSLQVLPLRARPIKLLHQIFTLEFVSWETRSKKIHQPQPCLVLWECHQEFSFRDIIQVPACPLPLVNHILSESLPLSTPATADWPTSNLKRWSGPVGMASLWITV